MKNFNFTIQGNKYDVKILDVEDNIAEIEVNGTLYKVEVDRKFTPTKTPRLVRSVADVYNRAVTVDATPEQIYPWLVQMGAEKGGLYSYSWFETNVLRCELINADRIHEEWQDLKVGDKVKMCPATSGPPAYEVALLDPNQAIVLGHQENGQWSDVWQFALRPQEDGTTRFLIRGRSTLTGMLWDIIRPGEFIMMRGMMLGIKERAEEIKQGRQAAPVVTVEPATPTPEIFNPLNPSPTPSDSTVPMTCQITDLNVYISEEWGYCFAYPAKYTLDESRASEGIISLSGPALEDNPDPIRVSLEVTKKLVPENSILSSLVDAYLGTFSNVILPMPISRESLNLGNEPAEKIDPIPQSMGPEWVLAKGGHLPGTPVDVCTDGKNAYYLENPRLDAPHHHGTGCCLATALAAHLANGHSVPEAVNKSRELVKQALKYGLPLGQGVGPVNPFAPFTRDLARYEVLEALQAAGARLVREDLSPLIPEVMSNLGYAAPYSEGPQDVAAFPGRILKTPKGTLIPEAPAFGASRHIASIILTAIQFFPNLRSAINIRYRLPSEQCSLSQLCSPPRRSGCSIPSLL